MKKVDTDNIRQYLFSLTNDNKILNEDYKEGRYTPFMEYINKREELKIRVDRLISISLGLLASSIDRLNLQVNRGIIENIVYSGVYLRYKNSSLYSFTILSSSLLNSENESFKCVDES